MRRRLRTSAKDPKRRRAQAALNCSLVGIGASAGGLKAFAELLSALPADGGMAVVLIQHLDSERPSSLAEVLQKSCRMPVHELDKRTEVQPNNVYVIAPGTRLTLEGNCLVPGRRPSRAESSPFLPIDHFFRSLAKELKSRAVGVVLSGTARDGTEGLRAIKAEGGITYVQEPGSASFAGMPESALASGAVDFSLPAEKIGHELTALARHPYIANDEDQPAASAGEEPHLEEIFRTVEASTGINFSEYKPNTFRRRLARRMALKRIATLAAYAQHLRDSPGEAQLLYEDVLIHVTSFFRDESIFEELKKVAFPRILEQRKPSEIVRIWVAGCALGEEAYSIAMSFFESIGKAGRQQRFQIFASDLSERAIERARTGFYPQSAVRGLSKERLERFFHPIDGGYRVNPELRERCIFVRHDLARDPPLSKMDLVSCRNVLIYFSSELQKRVLGVFHYSLNPHGVLLLGRSETAAAQPTLFAPVRKGSRLYARIDAPNPVRFGGVRGRSERGGGKLPVALMTLPQPSDLSLQLDRLLLAHGPSAVIVNDRFEIVEYRGRTAPFLEQRSGQPQLNVLKLVRPGLLAEFRGALSQAKKTKAAVRKHGLRVEAEGSETRFDLLVLPLPGQRAATLYALLFLSAEERPASKSAPKKAAKAEPTRAARVTDLEQELAATRDYLQSIVDEHQRTNDALTAANEELVSGNEELQSMNEELETAKEELQSSNEELTTVNDEVQARSTEIGVVNADLLNVLNSIEMPLMILDGQRRIRRITPRARELMNVLPTDIGRPISDIRLNVDIPNLSQLIGDSMETVSLKQQDVADANGRWQRVQVRPYKTADNRIDGVVLSLTDIDLLKRAVSDAEWARDFANGIVEAVPQPLLVLDGARKVLSANPSFCAQFKLRRAQVFGQLFFELDDAEWNAPRLRDLVARALRGDSSNQPIEIERRMNGAGKRTFLIHGRPLRSHDGGALCLLSFEDITARIVRDRQALQELERAQSERSAAQGASLAKDELLATVSHDLRTPFAALLMQAKLIKSGTLSDEALVRATELIERTVKLQARLVDDLLDVSRIVTGKLRLEKKPLNLSEVIGAGLAVVEPLAKQRGVVIEHALMPDLFVVGDASRLQQVAWNLFSNAIKFSSERGLVRVSLDRDAQWVTLMVSDAGLGLSAEDLPHIFDRFMQAERSTDHSRGGLGLGLSIVKHVVERHGGQVKAESPGRNQGSTFTVRLPLAETTEAGQT